MQLCYFDVHCILLYYVKQILKALKIILPRAHYFLSWALKEGCISCIHEVLIASRLFGAITFVWDTVNYTSGNMVNNFMTIRIRQWSFHQTNKLYTYLLHPLNVPELRLHYGQALFVNLCVREYALNRIIE